MSSCASVTGRSLKSGLSTTSLSCSDSLAVSTIARPREPRWRQRVPSPTRRTMCLVRSTTVSASAMRLRATAHHYSCTSEISGWRYCTRFNAERFGWASSQLNGSGVDRASCLRDRQSLGSNCSGERHPSLDNVDHADRVGALRRDAVAYGGDAQRVGRCCLTHL